MGGVAVEAAAGPVTASWSADRLRGSFLHVAQRHPGVKRGGVGVGEAVFAVGIFTADAALTAILYRPGTPKELASGNQAVAI